LENKDQSQIIPEIVIDSKITFSEITPKFVRILDQFAPFGPGNLRPTFLSEKVKVIHPPKLVGGNHLVLVVKQNGTDKIFDAIGFNLSYFANFIEKDKNLIDIVYSIDKIIKDGKSFPQLRIKDIKLSM
jgi:single-stranded-DNA-specific exonuclease